MRPARSPRLARLCFAGLAALTAVLAGLALLGGGSPHVLAITNDDDIQFTVTQSPAAPVVVQPGSQVQFSVAATATVAYPAGLFFEFQYPAGLAFISSVSAPPGITCSDNTPVAGSVRCSYGAVNIGALVPLTLTFAANATATTAPTQVLMRAGLSDGAPDNAVAGTGDGFTGAGTITVLDAPLNVTVNDSTGASPIFEGGTSSYTVTLTNTTSSPTGAFNVSAALQNGTVQGVTCTASSGTNGAAGGTGSATATCTGSDLDAGATLTVALQVFAVNTAGGDDMLFDVTAPALGLLAGDFAEKTIAVDEVGLTNTGPSLLLGSTINVCTGTVAADVTDSAAAGAAQPNNGAALIGAPSGSIVLQLQDFTVTGPAAGAVVVATGCGANQSGVRFTPSAAGGYTVTAAYNVGGQNTLALTAVAPSPTPTPSPSPTPSPTPTPILTPTPTGQPSPTPTSTPTPTPSPTPTGTPTSTTSAQLVVSTPGTGVSVARSRLAFSATAGTLSPSSVSFVVKRKSDNKYWNGTTGSWDAGLVLNAATQSSGTWSYAVTGASRRLFAGTVVIVEARAVQSGQTFLSAVTPEIPIR